MIRHLATAAPAPATEASADDLRPGLTRTLADRLSRNVAAGVLGSTLALYLLTFLAVWRHYAEYPPHYDSIGIYAGLFELANQVQRAGIGTVLAGAFASGTSWLLPAYGLALAWAPVRAPEWLVSLNFLLLLAAQGATVTYGRTFGFSRLRQVVTALLPLIPGALYAWDGGIEDLRRDAQLILLALAVLFLSLAYVSAPTRWRGLALGLTVGLAQWSRDNAASVIAIVALPAIVLAVVRARQGGGLGSLVRLATLPLGVFVLLALPYYAITLPLTIERYRTSVWGIGESRVESLLAFWSMPVSVLLGGDPRLSGRLRVAFVTAGLLLAGLAALGALIRTRAVTFDTTRLKQPGSALLLASGGWVVLAVMLYNTLLLGYGARWHGVPFLPIYVGLVAIMAGLLGAVRRASDSPSTNGRTVGLVAGAGCMLLVLSAPLRMLLAQPPALGEAGVDAIRSAAFQIADLAGDRPVALLAFDTLSRHHAAYYLAQAGRPRLTEFESVAIAHGDPIDLDQPVRDGDDPELLRARLDTSLRRWADFALVYADTARYADPREPLWPYQLGQPVVQPLLADPDWRPVARFTLRERNLVLLENLHR